MVVGLCPGLSTQHHRLTQTKTLAQAHITMHMHIRNKLNILNILAQEHRTMHMHIRDMYVQRKVHVHYIMIYI